MKTNRRRFLQATAATATAGVLPAEMRPISDSANLDGFQIAKRHAIVHDLPTPDFFEGMLLGNGDIGVCITVRPDALGLHLGKEDSWDIRVSEDHYQHVLPFDELLKLWERASEEAKRQGKPDMLDLEHNIDFFRDYTAKGELILPEIVAAPLAVRHCVDSLGLAPGARAAADPRPFKRHVHTRNRARRPSRPSPEGDDVVLRELEFRPRAGLERCAGAHRLHRLLSQHRRAGPTSAAGA